MQTRLSSLAESMLDVLSGFLINLVVWVLIVVPFWELPLQMHENLQITAVFTVVGIARRYCWRRFFNWRA